MISHQEMDYRPDLGDKPAEPVAGVEPGKHLGLPVPGYRPQSTEAVQLVSVNKQIEERVLRQLDQLKSCPDVDQRWLAIARTHIEQGFMAANRAVFKPARVSLPGDNGEV